jgi:hypothetical protein
VLYTVLVQKEGAAAQDVMSAKLKLVTDSFKSKDDAAPHNAAAAED